MPVGIPVPHPANRPMIAVATNEDIQRAREKEQQEQADRTAQNTVMVNLAGRIRQAFTAADTSKRNDIEERLFKCLRQRLGIYDPQKLQEIKNFGGSKLYMLLTNVKVRAARAWIRDVMLPPGEVPWSLRPSPIPELPAEDEQAIGELVTYEMARQMYLESPTQGIARPEAIRDRILEVREKVTRHKTEKAKKATRWAEKRIEDDLLAGGYYEAMDQFIDDLVTYPAAFMVGPVVTGSKVLQWAEEGGTWKPEVAKKMQRRYYRLSPFDAFPSPGSKSVQDGYFIERLRLRRRDLMNMMGAPGVDDNSVTAALFRYGKGGANEWSSAMDKSREELENRPNEEQDPDPPIHALRYWGSAQGKDLLEWGMDPKQVPHPENDYEIVAILIGEYVIMARLNPHPLNRRPVYSTSWDKNPDSIWGKCPPELMRDLQDVCNSAARAIVNNLAMASGPQVEVQTDRLAPGETADDMWPWRIWRTQQDERGTGHPAVRFFQPNPMTDVLRSVYDYFFKQASEQTGIPGYIYGDEDISGAGKTASGLSMLMNAAAKTLKDVVSHIDDDVVRPSIKEHWTHLMLHDEDNEIKCGDVQVICRASDHLIIAEQLAMRRKEFLENTNNPVDLAIIGLEGRAKVLREQVKTLKMDDDIVPSDEDLQQKLNPMGGPGAGMTGPGMMPQGIPMPPGAAGPEVGPDGNPAGGEQVRGMAA